MAIRFIVGAKHETAVARTDLVFRTDAYLSLDINSKGRREELEGML